MVKLRLKRIGRKKRPYYRIVAMDVNRQRDGQALSQLGTYDPLMARFSLDEDAMVAWIKNGAQMTPTVRNLLKSRGVLARMQGLEGVVRENPLSTDKPKRRKKLGSAAVVAAEAEEKAPETPSPSADAETATSAEAPASAEAVPEATAETSAGAAEADAEAKTEADASGTESSDEA